MERLEVLKTYKIYIGGKFPRTESGRTFLLNTSKGKPYANVCQCSRKDFRDAVVAARAAFGGWNERAAFNRGQILYRIAEMLEGRKAQFIEELVALGSSPNEAKKEVELAIDRTVYYSGWCDKYHQVFGSVNPVASSHFNFSSPEATGVVTIIAGDQAGLINLVSLIMPVIAGGNTCILIAPEKNPLCAVTLAEVLNSSDVPGGVVNVLTGFRKEFMEHVATHLDVNAVIAEGLDKEQITALEKQATSNLKRIFIRSNNWFDNAQQSPYFIMDTQEIKTTWHPVENIGGSGSGY